MPVELIRKYQTVSFYTSPERLYLTADGDVVGAKDPRKQTLLVAAGGQIPLEDAQRYGLLEKPAVAPPVADDPVMVAVIAEPVPPVEVLPEPVPEPEPDVELESARKRATPARKPARPTRK